MPVGDSRASFRGQSGHANFTAAEAIMDPTANLPGQWLGTPWNDVLLECHSGLLSVRFKVAERVRSNIVPSNIDEARALVPTLLNDLETVTVKTEGILMKAKRFGYPDTSYSNHC